MKAKLLVLAALAVMYYSCTVEEQPIMESLEDSPTQTEASLRSHVVSLEAAKEELDQVLENVGLPETKSQRFQQGKVFTISSKINETRSETENEPLLYIVNFEDDGYAILAADDRIKDPVLAVAIGGNISVNDFQPYTDFIADEDDDLDEDDYNSMSLAGYVGSSNTERLIASLCYDYAIKSAGEGDWTPCDSLSDGNTDPITYEWVVTKRVNAKLSNC